MKKLVIISLILIIFILIFIGSMRHITASSNNVSLYEEWQYIVGGESEDIFYTVTGSPDGGYVLLGRISGDYKLIRLDENGVEQWNKTLNDSNYKFGFDSEVFVDSDGGYLLYGGFGGFRENLVLKLDSNAEYVWKIFYGHTNRFNPFDYDGGGFFIVKLGSDNSVLWSKKFFDTGLWINSLITTSDGGCVAVGTFFSGFYDGLSGYDGWVLKIDSFGLIEWEKIIDNYYYDQYCSEDVCCDDAENFDFIVEDQNGDYVLVGEANGDMCSTSHASDAWIIKINKMGDVIWNMTYSQYQRFQILELSQSMGYIIIGKTGYSSIPSTPAEESIKTHLIRINETGNLVWNINEIVPINRNGIVESNDGGYIIAYDNYISKIDYSGIKQWNIIVNNNFQSICLGQNDTYVLVGSMQSDKDGNSYAYAVKIGNTPTNTPLTTATSITISTTITTITTTLTTDTPTITTSQTTNITTTESPGYQTIQTILILGSIITYIVYLKKRNDES